MSIPAGLTRRTAISVTEEGASHARHGDRQGEQGFGSGRAAEPRDSQRDGQVQRGAGEGRRDAGRRGAALERQGRASQVRRRQLPRGSQLLRRDSRRQNRVRDDLRRSPGIRERAGRSAPADHPRTRRLWRPVPARLRCAGGPLPGAAGLRGDGGAREAGRRRAHLQGARRERHHLHALPGDLLGARLRHVHRPLRDALDGQLRQAARSGRGGARALLRLGRTRLRVTWTPLACAAPRPMVSSVAMTATDAHRTIDAVWRIESARLIAGLTRVVRDVGLAEELAQDALVRALEEWPRSGLPDNPGAWLMATAKNRGIDHLRHEHMRAAKHEALGHELEMEQHTNGARLEAKADDEIGDDLLRLIFIACHPLLSTEARTALTLRLLAGLTTEEIARAFLVPEPTIAQRIVRAKRTLSDAHVPFEIPRGKELAGRLSSVLEVIYLVFNEGYSATAGEDWMRPALCEEALRIGRILAELAPLEPEVHGLVALMEIQ